MPSTSSHACTMFRSSIRLASSAAVSLYQTCAVVKPTSILPSTDSSLHSQRYRRRSNTYVQRVDNTRELYV